MSDNAIIWIIIVIIVIGYYLLYLLEEASLERKKKDEESKKVISNEQEKAYITELIMRNARNTSILNVNKITDLTLKRINYLKQIEEFHTKYNLLLGETVKTILKLKMEILYNKVIKQIQPREQDKLTILEAKFGNQQEALENMNDVLDNSEFYLEYEEAKTQYNGFSEEYKYFKESQKEKYYLNEQDEAELKQLTETIIRKNYSEIVHKVSIEVIEETMKELTTAYLKQDLTEIKKLYSIAALLGDSFAKSYHTDLESARINEMLINMSQAFNDKIKHLELELDAILQDKTYQMIAAIEDWDKYFDELRQQLTEEKERLEAENRAISEVNDEANSRYQGFDSEKISNKIDPVLTGIQKENSHYAKHIQSIQVPNFERIRQYCNNLVDEHKADEMQKYLAENGKMHKALIYDALEQFIKDLEGQSVTLIDWGCGQGIASMLVLDYIREKQLDIKVSLVILIDDDIKALSRAMAQAEALKQEDLIIEAIDKVQGDIIDGNTPKIHLFVNDKIPTDLTNIDFGDDYVVCLSHQTTKTIDSISQIVDGREISKRDGKIGRFKRFERILKLDRI
jgi:hypothetical protein